MRLVLLVTRVLVMITFSLGSFFGLFSIETHAAGLININTADNATLDTLPGIGPSRAAAIVDYRNTQGAFLSIEEIMNISGIGEGIFSDIKSMITVGSGTSPTPEAVEVLDDNKIVPSQKMETKDVGELSRVRIFKDDPLELRLAHQANAYVGQAVQFSVTPRGLSESSLRTLEYLFNFGDGTTDNTRTPLHRYKAPGKYVVIVEAFRQGHQVMVRSDITVLPLKLSLDKKADGSLMVQNDASYEADISSVIITDGFETFVFPEHSYLATRGAIVLPFETQSFGSNISLANQMGEVVAVFLTHEKSIPNAMSASVDTRQVENQSTGVITEEAASISPPEESEQKVATVAESAADDTKKDEQFATGAFIAVMFLGIFALYAHKLV